MKQAPRATLWLCAYQGLTVGTHLSIVREMLSWGPNLRHQVKAGDANIDRARSKVASWFLAEERAEAGDVLLMVDSDNAWEDGDLQHIAVAALEKKAVVGGIYSKRTFGGGYACRFTDGAAGTWEQGKEAFIQAEFVGTGFIAIPRAVLERIGDNLPVVKGEFQPFFMPYVLPDPYQVEYPTDDQAFCARARAVGFKVYAATKPVLTHEGAFTYRMQDAETTAPTDRKVKLLIPERPQVAV